MSDLSAYFEAYVTKADRLRKHLEVLADLRELLVADRWGVGRRGREGERGGRG